MVEALSSGVAGGRALRERLPAEKGSILWTLPLIGHVVVLTIQDHKETKRTPDEDSRSRTVTAVVSGTKIIVRSAKSVECVGLLHTGCAGSAWNPISC